MKDNALIFAKTLITIFIAVLIFIVLAGCSTNISQTKEKVHDMLSNEPASIEEAVICEKVDDSSAPINITSVFPTDTKAIYLSVKVKNFTHKDKLYVTWKYLETDAKIDTQEFTINKDGSGYIGFNIKIAEGLPSGKYSAEIYLNDKLVKTKEFSVK